MLLGEAASGVIGLAILLGVVGVVAWLYRTSPTVAADNRA